MAEEFSTTVHLTVTLNKPHKRSWWLKLLPFIWTPSHDSETVLDTWRFREGMRMKEAAISVAESLGYSAKDVRIGDETAQTEYYYVTEPLGMGAYKHILMHCIPYASLEH